MKAITVRNLPPDVAREVRRRAKEDRTSLNGAVLRLLKERLGARSADGSKRKLHYDLDFLCATWTKKEADEFDKSLARQRTIDAELWE
jgi:uncharacterized protein (DUF2267 family)